MLDCPFCKFTDVVLQNDLAYARFDTHPVNPGHLLVLPRRHVAGYFDVTSGERAALFDLIDSGKALLDARFRPHGYNIGVNVDECAGQTVMHVHVHLIPRYRGDMVNPRGGVRGVIPAKQDY